MDALQFDELAAKLASRLNRRRGLGILAGVSVPLLGLSGNADAKKKKTVTLCANGQTVKAPKKKAKKLLKKGASKGACLACPAGQKPCGNTCISNLNCCVTSDCGPGGTCDRGRCVFIFVPPTCGNGGVCSAFLTSETFTGGEIEGLAGADQHCRRLARAAGLQGNFIAWLSAGSQSPDTRFVNLSPEPWRLRPNAVDGSNLPPIVATNFSDLTTCGATCLQNPINRTETGEILPGSVTVWTNTLADGTASTDSCEGWTSSDIGDVGLFGDASQVDAKWTNTTTTFGCNSELSLYCFETAS